jgi:putative acetyltransferase
MERLLRTDYQNLDFIELVKQLDADIAERESDSNLFFSQFNKIDNIKFVIVAYKNDKAIGCGAIMKYDRRTMEIKRMFVLPVNRGYGIAAKILSELEDWAYELGYNECVLQTVKKHPEAIGLYKKHGYIQTPNYGQYTDDNINSVCFKKSLTNKRPN